jgi:hypothetical protein
MLAVTGATWIQVVLVGSIVVPVTVAAALTWFFLRKSRDDPDQQRLRRIQAEYEARQRHG